MSEDVFILGVSYLGPDGFGNDRRGLLQWPEPLAAELQRGNLGGLHWSLLSDSDPSRFLRMDLMCRMGFMAAELLDARFDTMTESTRELTGVCFESFSGCMDTDIQFVTAPRPSLFAYTLPSTVVGELCIRHRLKGPVMGIIPPAADKGEILAEAADWLRCGDAEMALCLGIEAVNRKTEEGISLPDALRAKGWHACAVLLGRDGNSERARPFLGGAIGKICRDLCAGDKELPRNRL